MEWYRFVCDGLLLPTFMLLLSTHDNISKASRDISRPALKVSDKTQPLPIVEEVPDSVNLPVGRDLNPRRLLRKLGEKFDERWMSVEEPGSTRLGSVQMVSGVGTYNERLIEELNVTDMPFSSPALTEQVQTWLLSIAHCPVSYTWTNIGPLFWPPWVKRGSCEDKSCSWPSGMRCAPGETTIIRLMRWHCRPQRTSKGSTNSPPKPRCKWLQVPYPVTSECMCSCT